MRATIWGCRGTLASPGPETIHYGGQTSCIVLDLDDGSVVILDAGTGIRPYGISLAGVHPPRVDLLITHLHADHIEGLRFFAPFWDPNVEFHIWGPPAPAKGLEQRLAPFFAPPFFPVHLCNVPSRPQFHEVPDRPWTIGSATVSAELVKHPGPAVGYRIEEGGRSLAYLPDHEPGLGTDLRTMEDSWISGLGDRAGGRRARPRRAVHGVGVRAARRLGSLEHDRCRDVRGARGGSTASCCSTTTRCTPTRTSRPCSRMPAGWPAPARSTLELGYEGQTFALA